MVVGVGLSARPQHFSKLLEKKQVPWLEVLADNYQNEGSPAYDKLEKLAQIYPLVFHCIGFNLGSMEPLDRSYLDCLKKLVRAFQPTWISDHLCFCGNGHYSPDLLPIPYTNTMLHRIAEKVKTIMGVLEIPMLIENVSAYLRFKESTYTEEEFLTKLLQESSAGLLLDVNNLYVNAQNFSFDPYGAFLQLPREFIKQIHLAGYADYGSYMVDTHGAPVSGPVLKLYGEIIKDLGQVPVAIEWDNNIPPFSSMLEEVSRVYEIYRAQ